MEVDLPTGFAYPEGWQSVIDRMDSAYLSEQRRWQAVIDSMDLTHLPWGCRVELQAIPGTPTFNLRILLRTIDRPRDNAERASLGDYSVLGYIVPLRDQPTFSVSLVYTVQFRPQMSLFDIARQIRFRIHEAIKHEIDENILVAGERLFDPHKNDRP
jgi:hypothetical protein